MTGLLDRERRARAAILDTLTALASAARAHDAAPVDIDGLRSTVRRWIEEQTFAPAPVEGQAGVHLVDEHAARYGNFDQVVLVGLIEGEWPERPRRNIFYAPTLLGALGWPSERDWRSAAEARFVDLLGSAATRASISTVTLDDEALVAHIAKPLLATLGAQIVWPVAVATPSGSTMMIRETTDRQSPLALEQYSAGVRVPMLGSAAGRAYLAFCPAPQREAMLELLARSSLPEDRVARNRTEVERLLNETRGQGFGMAQRARRVSEETSLAIPVRAKNRILATVTVRYAATAVPLRTAIDQFLPKMREVAQKIEAQFA